MSRMTLDEVRAAIRELEGDGLVERAGVADDGQIQWRLSELGDAVAFHRELKARGFALPAISPSMVVQQEFFVHRAVLSEVA